MYDTDKSRIYICIPFADRFRLTVLLYSFFSNSEKKTIHDLL